MRLRLAAIAALLCCAVSADPARAGSYAIDFSSLAGRSGQTITSFASQGFVLTDAAGFLIVGPSSPDFDGVVGLDPLGGPWTLADHTPELIFSPDDPGLQFRPAMVGRSASFALTLAGSLDGATQWIQGVVGDYDGDYFGVAPGLVPVGAVVFANSTANPYQVTGLLILTAPSSVPEPSGAVPGGIALAVGAVAARVRWRRRAA